MQQSDFSIKFKKECQNRETKIYATNTLNILFNSVFATIAYPPTDIFNSSTSFVTFPIFGYSNRYKQFKSKK